MVCEEKKTLLAIYREAAQKYSAAVVELHGKIGKNRTDRAKRIDRYVTRGMAEARIGDAPSAERRDTSHDQRHERNAAQRFKLPPQEAIEPLPDIARCIDCRTLWTHVRNPVLPALTAV